ncbi:MAG: DUF177 domain-containing protein [Oscillospiraceae bacterium]|nr:DUF177 domain-containing protein [Oscillospiraceae bacterium]
MRLNLSRIIEIPGESVSFETELETEGLEFPAVRAYLTKPHAVGRVVNEAGVLRLEGTLTAELDCVCDRCGTPITRTKQTPLHATIVEEDDGENPELFLLEGTEIDLDEILVTNFVLDMESKLLCREDCQGLCHRCGKNLNLGPCGCGKEKDPRLAVLEQLLDK